MSKFDGFGEVLMTFVVLAIGSFLVVVGVGSGLVVMFKLADLVLLS